MRKEWLQRFGPGAILASLTIGVGELVFSTRAGALFEYRLLWFFALALFLKWTFTYATARHFVLTGAHPFERWMELPGPRGWFPATFLALAVISFPIWVAFHSGTMGTLIAALTGTAGTHLYWGLAALGLVTFLALLGGYKTLEKAQLAIVAVMLIAVLAAFFLLNPDWSALASGFLPQRVTYPVWAEGIAQLKARPVWVETVTYVGVIGGSGYDYLAYVSYLREKGWRGQEGLRLARADSIVSFAAVLLFTVVFTACGAMVLNPQQTIPAGGDLLTLQAQFVTPLLPSLKYLYFAGAALAVFGTLYGTVEVGPAIWREAGMALGLKPGRRAPVAWVCGAAAMLLVGMVLRGKSGNPPELVAVLTPANLFTGVLACGFISLLAVWADWRWNPRRMPLWLAAANVVGSAFFLFLGLKAYSDYDSAMAWLILAGTVGVGWITAKIVASMPPQSKTGF